MSFRLARFSTKLITSYATRPYEFVQVDVFTQTPLAGNPLAIFPDAAD
jgi:hypothetical protein